MGSMRASPAGLLLLALALIAAVYSTKAAYGDNTVTETASRKVNPRIALETPTAYEDGEEKVADSTVEETASRKVITRIVQETPTVYGDGEEKVADNMMVETASRRVNVRVAQETSGVTTTVLLGAARLSFSKQRCMSVGKKAGRKSVKVWWNGRGGSSSVGSGGEATGVACSQVKFFGKRGCQGKVVDSMVNPGTTDAMFPSSEKKLRKGASVASVQCDVPEQQQEEEETPPEVIRDPACDALGCGPGGKCEVDQNGERYCKWDSLCGTCPTGAFCKTVPSEYNSTAQVPYCTCPQGYGLTATKCVAGASPTVGSFSITLIANRTARDNSSRPYTVRFNLNNCTQYPDAVAGKYRARFTVEGIDDAPDCPNLKVYKTNNCEGEPFFTSTLLKTKSYVGQHELDLPPIEMPRSIFCTQ
ncbi:unnamed protein product [Closterium sp. NIES-54]